MVQREIKKRTQLYGTGAFLAAMILVSLIFVFGSTPSLIPSEFPEGGTPDTVPAAPPEVSVLNNFVSYDELKTYLLTNTEGTSTYTGGPLDAQIFGRSGGEPAPSTFAFSDSGVAESNSYSTTNIQVAGVDEADIVKTDGSYIYVASNDYSGQNYIYILKADPQDPRVISRIPLNNETYLAGMFLSQDNNKLVVIGSQYQFYALDTRFGSAEGMIYPYNNEIQTFISVYDVSDKVYPVRARNLTLTGSYFNSRMIGNYVYAVVSQPAQVFEEVVTLPRIYSETTVTDVSASKVYYADTMPGYFTFTTFIGLNILDNQQEITNMTVLMGGASTMYVSLNNVYITYPGWDETGSYTSIYRVSVEEEEIGTEQAKGSVPGYALNQYSMDENNGYFRLATTIRGEIATNTVYVLDSNLTKVGEVKLENAELRETIHSVRFMGDKAYVVTFEQKDPFFVLNMSDPENPTVSGALEIPGFSSYLHPYDENYIIGLGMENGSVKLSLFDVTNVNSPAEASKYIAPGDYSYSEAQYEPKAFLFDKEKELLVIPISITTYGEITPRAEEGGEEESGETTIAPDKGGYWEGAYVFKVTATSGFELRGGVTQQENNGTINYYGDYNLNVRRTLYIGNTLYTVSNARVQLNTLDDLGLIAKIDLR